MTEQAPPDFRPVYAAALEQAARVVAAADPSRLDAPTPCAEYDVRALMEHVLLGVRRFEVIGTGADASTVTAEPLGPDPAAELRAAGDAAEKAWSDDAVLDRPATAPWATLPGRVMVAAYVMELGVHTWDLARATGWTEPLDPQVGGVALAGAQQALPAEPRGEEHGVPFGAPIPVPDDADVWTRLAAWTGRTP